MFTIMDYAKYYKDVSLGECHMNEGDIMVMTIISYMPIDSFTGDKSFPSLIDEILSADYDRPLWLMAPKVRELAGILKDSLRYQDMIITDFDHKIDESSQFGAVTFSFDGKKIICYEGSDGSSPGWFENFRVAYQYPTVTQSLALNYLNLHASDTDELYIAGHSKGGNLAIVSAMNFKYKNQIKIIYNFDGPGLRKSETETEGFRIIESKIRNVIPEGSYLGCLLHNTGKYYIIRSNEKGFYIHYPTSWEMFGGFFVTDAPMSEISVYLHTLTTKGFDSLDQAEAGKLIEGSFKALELNKDDKFRVSFKGFLRAVDSIHKSDEGVRKFLKKTVGIMWLATKKKNVSLVEIEKINQDSEKED